MALLDPTLNLEIVVVHPVKNGTNLERLARKELQRFYHSLKENNAIGLKVARGKNTVVGRAFYIRGKRFDMSTSLKDLVISAGGARLVPPIGDVYEGVTDLKNRWVTALERCIIKDKGLPPIYEVLNLSQAFYVLKCYNEMETFDLEEFKALRGKTHFMDNNLLEGNQSSPSTTPVLENREQSSPSTEVEPDERVLSSPSTTVQPESRDLSSSSTTVSSESMNEQTELLKDIKNILLEYLPKIDNNTAEILNSKLEQVVTQVVTPSDGLNLHDRFDNSNYLSEGSEKFLLWLFSRLEDLLDYGYTKAKAYRVLESEAKTNESIIPLTQEFIRVRGRGAFVTHHNIQEYLTKRYTVLEGKDSKGNITKRVVKNHDVDKKKVKK